MSEQPSGKVIPWVKVVRGQAGMGVPGTAPTEVPHTKLADQGLLAQPSGTALGGAFAVTPPASASAAPGTKGPVIDLAASAAELRSARVAELTALLKVDLATAIMIIVEREGDAVPMVPDPGTGIVYTTDGEIQVQRILARLGFGTALPLTYGGLRGVLKYGNELIRRVGMKPELYPASQDLLYAADSKLMQAGNVAGLAQSHADAGITFDTLAEDFQINGDINWGGLADSQAKFWKIQHGRHLILLPWWDTLRSYGDNYSAPYVSGRHPFLLLPEFAPLRALPLNVGYDKHNLGSLLSGDPAVDMLRDSCSLNDRLGKYSMYVGETEVVPYGLPDIEANREKVGYLSFELCEVLPALEAYFKKLKVKPEEWLRSVVPFAWHIQVGSEPEHRGVVHSMRHSRLAFTVPVARKRGGGRI